MDNFIIKVIRNLQFLYNSLLHQVQYTINTNNIYYLKTYIVFKSLKNSFFFMSRLSQLSSLAYHITHAKIGQKQKMLYVIPFY